MYDAEVKPLKGTGTRWTNFEVHKMYRLVEKFGLYVGHLNEVEAKTCKSTDRAALQGQITKLMDAKALLRWAFFTGVLAETEHFSMVTQRKSINIIKVFYAVETAKSNYERLLNKVKKKKNPVFKFELPNIKPVVDSIESSEGGGNFFQDQKLNYHSREKWYLEDHAAYIIELIIGSFEECCGNLFSGHHKTINMNINSDDGERVLFDVTRILNWNVWHTSNISTEDEDYSLQQQFL